MARPSANSPLPSTSTKTSFPSRLRKLRSRLRPRSHLSPRMLISVISFLVRPRHRQAPIRQQDKRISRSLTYLEESPLRPLPNLQQLQVPHLKRMMQPLLRSLSSLKWRRGQGSKWVTTLRPSLLNWLSPWSKKSRPRTSTSTYQSTSSDLKVKSKCQSVFLC